MTDRDRIQKLEELVATLIRNTAHIPARWGEDGGSGDDLPVQLAVVTQATQTAAYSGSGLTFAIDNTAPMGKAILLTTETADADPFIVDTDSGTTLGELEFNFYSAHKDVPIGVGDVIRVWKRNGELVEPGDGNTQDFSTIIFGEHWNFTQAARRLGGYDDNPAEPLFLQTFDDVLYWDVGLEGPMGPQGPQGDPGTPGTNYTAGYAIDIESDAIHFDPTEITNFSAASFQIFAHNTTGGQTTDRDDPPWLSVADYDATKNQMWWHKSGGFVFETTTDYAGAANAPQLLVNWGAGNGGEWQWNSLEDYDATAKTQLIVNLENDWRFKTIANYDTTKDQLPWSDNGAWKWEEANKLTAIKIPTSIELNIVGTAPNQTLEVKLNYTEYTLFGVAGNTGNISDTVDADPFVCP